MTDLIPFAFDDELVRVVMRGGEPWFVGKDVCACLGVKNHNDAISALDGDEKGVASTDPLGAGGEQAVVIVSEPGVYRLVFRSRKPEAERFKRWLAHDVLPQLRKAGRCDVLAPAAGGVDVRQEPLLHRLQLVRECRAIHGRAVAKLMWRQLGLPAVPPPPPTAVDEARVCLRQLLDAVPPGGSTSLRTHLALAMDEAEHDRLIVMCAGVRPALDGRDGFLVANCHPFLDEVFQATEWSRGGHMRVLRRLPGSVAAGTTRFAAHQRRATFLPGEYLDDEVVNARQ